MHQDFARATTIGPYQLRGVLGRGGMGVVYRGEHLDTGALVAVKTLHSRARTPLASIRREIEALERLRHPGIVRIVGHGVSDGMPWYAMDLLTGRTLRDCLNGDAEHGSRAAHLGASTETRGTSIRGEKSVPLLRRVQTRAVDQRQNLAVVARCCSALSYLHAMGAVHRDLKPENIFVRDDGMPVLVDLGLVASFGGQQGRERLDPAGGAFGTAAYMAPEQIRGELVDARADLYALGCILYECVTGEPPFAGMPTSAILNAQLGKRPLPPSSLVDDVSPALDGLIVGLLEKRPDDRVGYAEDVAAVLASSVDHRSAETSFVPGGRHYLYRPPFVGREEAVRELNEAVQKMGSGGGRVFIGGESGVGKTRLVLEAINETTCPGVRVVLSRCGALGVGSVGSSGDGPLQAFAPALLAIADYCRSGASDGVFRLGPWAKVLSPYQPSLEHVPGYEWLPEPPSLAVRDARARVFGSLSEALYGFALVQPLVIVIDDLQWADELSLGYLGMVPTGIGALLVVATYRAEEAEAALRLMVSAPSVRHLELGRFGLDAIGAMIRGMLAIETPPPNLVRALQQKCNGNPFFVLSYLQAAIAEGVLVRQVGGNWQLGASKDLSGVGDQLEMPGELEELIDLRFKYLDEGALNLIRVGAVLGREFDADLLMSCVQVAPPDAAGTLQTLRQRQLLEEGENGELRFVHDKIRERVYQRIPHDITRALHRRAAEALSSRQGDAPDTSVILAEHYSRAGLPDAAANHFARAGDFAASAYANGDAVRRYRAALHELKLAGHGWSAHAPLLLEKIGDVLTVSGEHAAARGSFEEAIGSASRLPALLLARLFRKTGKTWEVHHAYEPALESYRRGAEVLSAGDLERDSEWWHEVIQVTIERLWVNYWLNDIGKMETIIEQSCSMIETEGSDYQRARFMQLMAMRNIRKERYFVSDETVRLARSAVSAARGANEEELAALRFVSFFTLFLRSKFAEAEREGQAVLEWANRAGASTLRARTLTYLAATARRQGRVKRVKELVNVIRGLHAAPTETGTAPNVLAHYPGALLANMSWLAFREENYEDLEKYANQAVAGWQSERVTYAFQWLARFPLLALADRRGDSMAAMTQVNALLSEQQQRLEESLASEMEAQRTKACANGAGLDATPIIKLAKCFNYV